MSTELEERLGIYGRVLDESIALASAASMLEKRSSFEWFRPAALGLAALAAVAVAFVLLRDNSQQGVVAILPGEAPLSELEAAAGQWCLKSLEVLIPPGEFSAPRPGFEPIEKAVIEGEPIAMLSPTDSNSVKVFVVGDTQLVVCEDLRGERFESMGISAIGTAAGATGVKIWSGPIFSDRPLNLSLYGVVADEVRGVGLVVGGERFPGVVRQGWFLVEATLTTAAIDGDDIAIEWTNTDGSTDSEAVPIAIVAADSDDDETELEAFCGEVAGLDDERPEAFVGSSEHVADIDRLLTVAPESIVDDLVIYRDYLASGAVDSQADPESNLFENWPTEVRQAVSMVQFFAENNCPG